MGSNECGEPDQAKASEGGRTLLTCEQLRAFLDRERVDPRSYMLDGVVQDECYCLVRELTLWHVFYSERGVRIGEEVFVNEEGACAHMLDLLIREAPRYQ